MFSAKELKESSLGLERRSDLLGDLGHGGFGMMKEMNSRIEDIKQQHRRLIKGKDIKSTQMLMVR